MSRLIDFIESQNAVDFQNQFKDTMASKVNIALEDEKVAVAQKFFGAPVAEVYNNPGKDAAPEDPVKGGLDPKVSKKGNQPKKGGGGGGA